MFTNKKQRQYKHKALLTSLGHGFSYIILFEVWASLITLDFFQILIYWDHMISE